MERHAAWQKIFFGQISRPIFKPHAKRFSRSGERATQRHDLPPILLNPDVLNSSTIPILLFEAKLLYESYQPQTCDSTQILRIWDPRGRLNRASRAKIPKSDENPSCAKTFAGGFLETLASLEHRAWQKRFFKQISRPIFNFISNEFLDPENEAFKGRKCHRFPRSKTTCILPLFRYHSSKQSCSASHINHRRATAPDFVHLRPPWTPKSGLSSENLDIWRKPITQENLSTRFSLDPGFAWTRRLAQNILQIII